MDRVLLVRSPAGRLYKTAGPDPGLGYLKTALVRQGALTLVYDAWQLPRFVPDFSRMVRDFVPDVVGFKMCTADLLEVTRLVDRAAANAPDAAIIVGGPYPTGMRENLFQALPPEVAAGFAGEAERALPAWLRARHGDGDPAAVPGLIVRENGGVTVRPQDFPADLDALDYPDYADMPLSHYPVDYEGHPYLPVMTTRGCPYGCAYCSASLINGRRLRRRSAEHIAEEVYRYRRDFGAEHFDIADDNFTHVKEHVLAVCEALQRRVPGMKWRCPNGIRLDTLDEEILRAMEGAGCEEVYVGIETGSERVAAAMNRGVTPAVLREKVELLRRVTKFRVFGFFLIGFPTEEEADLRATLRLALGLPLDLASFFYFTPHPGTRIFQELVSAGAIPPVGNHGFYERLGRLPRRVSERRLRWWQKYAYARFYLRPRQLRLLWQRMKQPAQARRLLRRILNVWLER